MSDIEKKIEAFTELAKQRDIVRKGGLIDWRDNLTKYCIVRAFNNVYMIDESKNRSHFLSFYEKGVAESFLKKHSDLINQAGDLI